jgi:hypothetical protein
MRVSVRCNEENVMKKNRRSTVSATGASVLLALLAASAPALAVLPVPCPKEVRFVADGANADFDPGWTGIFHDNPMIGVVLTANSACSGSTRPTCGTCTLSGPVPNTGGNNQRCAGATWMRCTTDTDCGASGPCHFFFGPPMPVSGGGVSACLSNEITGSLGGSLTVETGQFSPTLPLQWGVYLGGIIAQPCPRCVGDPTANDGITGGTCSGGDRNGQPCDTNATSPITSFGSTSFDCPPSAATSIGSLVIPSVPLATSTAAQTRTLSAANPFCSAGGFGSSRCQCDTCNSTAPGGLPIPCSTNADCPDPAGPVGPICGGRRCFNGPNDGAPCSAASECPSGFCAFIGEPTKPNGCNDFTCSPTSGGEGVCAAGPFEQFCGPNTPYQGCNDDTDCTFLTCIGGMNNGASCAAASECPGGGCSPGTCTIGKFRECYTDNGVIGGSVSVSGVADPPATNSDVASPVLGALFCMPPMSASSANAASGFPGLGRLRIPGTLTLAQEIVSRRVATPGTSVTTDNEGPGGVPNGASTSDPIETTVTSPNPGLISITEQAASGLPPSGFDFLDEEVSIQLTGAPGTMASPIVITFVIDSSRVPAGQTKDTINVYKDGSTTPILPCGNLTPGGPASPDPCIESRTLVFGSDVAITIRTISLSLWQFALPSDNPAFALPGKKLLVKDDDLAATKRKVVFLTKDASIFSGSPGGPADPTCAGSGGGGGALELKGAASAQDVSIPLPCAGWSAIGDPVSPKGYQYKDKGLTSGPCKVVVIKNGKLAKATCLAKNPLSPIAYDLTTGEGGISVTLTAGSATYCTDFSAATALIKEDDNRAFKAKDAIAPPTCP